MIKSEYQFSDVTETAIGCAMKVHSVLGNGFPEYIYQRAYTIELGKTSLLVQREIECPVYYDGKEIGKRRVDFMINIQVLIELKALSAFDATNNHQILNYLEAFPLPVGLLINFGNPKLEFRRFTNNKLKAGN